MTISMVSQCDITLYCFFFIPLRLYKEPETSKITKEVVAKNDVCIGVREHIFLYYYLKQLFAVTRVIQYHNAMWYNHVNTLM